jgi:hypothetical protein
MRIGAGEPAEVLVEQKRGVVGADVTGVGRIENFGRDGGRHWAKNGRRGRAGQEGKLSNATGRHALERNTHETQPRRSASMRWHEVTV